VTVPVVSAGVGLVVPHERARRFAPIRVMGVDAEDRAVPYQPR
jgi:hypothetical protein